MSLASELGELWETSRETELKSIHPSNSCFTAKAKVSSHWKVMSFWLPKLRCLRGYRLLEIIYLENEAFQSCSKLEARSNQEFWKSVYGFQAVHSSSQPICLLPLGVPQLNTVWGERWLGNQSIRLMAGSLLKLQAVVPWKWGWVLKHAHRNEKRSVTEMTSILRKKWLKL